MNNSIDIVDDGIDLENKMKDLVDIAAIEKSRKRGPGRPSKNTNGMVTANTYTDIVTVDDENNKKQRNDFESYLEKKYSSNANLLYQTIAQSDTIFNEINQEIVEVKDKKSSYGGKQKAITVSSLLGIKIGAVGAKINAIKELNNMRKNINDLVIKKEQIMKDTGDANSDKLVTDAYNVIMNSMKYGLPAINSPLNQSTLNTGITTAGTILPTANLNTEIIPIDNNESGSFLNNPNPIQNRMINEHNPAIKTVVVYDQSNGNRYFENINVNTGQRIENMQTPANFLLDDMRVDVMNGIATNSNANMTFPLVIIGNKAVDEL